MYCPKDKWQMEHIEPIQFKYASREMKNNDRQYADADQSKSQWNF